tara:strand:- start:10247 stop:10759 length:513 start_codon:yes stop_codon:yes gene_type:complete
VFQNKVYIALGTNLGNWKRNFNQSFVELNKLGFINNFSSVYISKPYGYKNQNLFYNTVIEFKTHFNPIKLIKSLKLIEKKLKKKKIIKNGPRIIDLDIIFYNKIILTNNLLTIPHPRAHLRDFVLYPIQEMNPFYRHPSEKKTIKELINKLENKFILKKIKREKRNVLIF